MGNIYSITSALKYHQITDITYTNDANELNQVDRIILPGVGSFKKAMSNIHELKLQAKLQIAVQQHNIPILGICLGMQLLGDSSTEHGFTTGLALFPAKVERFAIDTNRFKIPHVGFNTVTHSNNSKLYQEINESADFYFTHSYRMMIDNQPSAQIAYCSYGEKFVASFEQNNVYGTQFHPEKSQTNGLKLLENFLYNI